VLFDSVLFTGNSDVRFPFFAAGMLALLYWLGPNGGCRRNDRG
jgi:hypothetical protein